tara:strand:+ start:289 stop:486 length:198 start_codon:yes stop_codon:yes gene_type:complete
MTDVDKLFEAIEILRPNTPIFFQGKVVNEETFNSIKWDIGIDKWSDTNPHSEITWTKVKEEMDKL